jgi:hypothetical protein
MNELATNERVNHRVYGDDTLSLRGFLQSVYSTQSYFLLVTKLYFVTKLKAKLNFAEKCVPMYNLGTRKRLNLLRET